MSARLLTALWRTLHKVSPRLVGGCRPLRLADWIDSSRWEISAHEHFSPYGVLTSEAVVARPRG